MDTRREPTRRPAQPAFTLSVIVVILSLAQSVGGILIPGLYLDTGTSTLAGWHANDWVTLVLAVPLLAVALLLSARGSRRAVLVWLGMLAYSFYNIAFYLFGAALNRFFLIYVAIFTLSLLGLVFGLAGLDVGECARGFGARDPSETGGRAAARAAVRTPASVPAGAAARWVAAYMYLWAAALGIAWTAQMVVFIINGHLPPNGLEEEAFKLVAALDFPLVVTPVALAAAWLWRGRAWGYVLGVVLNVEGVVYTVVLTAGSLLASRAGVAGAAALVPLWVFLGVGSLLSTVALLSSYGSPRRG